jgi:hypothetical protein
VDTQKGIKCMLTEPAHVGVCVPGLYAHIVYKPFVDEISVIFCSLLGP